MPRQSPPVPTLPPLYDGWMTELLGTPVEGEPRATCSDCAMCRPTTTDVAPASVVGSPVSFDPDARCCTYQPEIWSFLAGAALADRSPGGAMSRASIRERIAAAEQVTPLGLGRSRRYATLYAASPDGFGRSHALRCPHYVVEGSLCAIWQHRNATCATWFCKHEHGAVSKRFWDRLQELLLAVEHAVARHAVLALDLGSDALQALFPIHPASAPGLTAADLDGHGDPAWQQRVWGRWEGRIEPFYLEAAALAAALSWDEISRLGGSDLALRVTLLREAHAALRSRAIPKRLRASTVSVSASPSQGPGTVVMSTYSGYDPLEVPEVLLRCLPYFDGRPTADALKAIEAALAVRLEPALVRRLHEFGVLTEA